jgi:hypothetical protein
VNTNEHFGALLHGTRIRRVGSDFGGLHVVELGIENFGLEGGRNSECELIRGNLWCVCFDGLE